jgi:prophage antirepressor-like protein
MEILPFTFQDSEIKAFINENGEIWFIAKYILETLEISTKHTSMTLKKLDSDELTTIKLLSGGQNREMKAISESGFYKIVLRSNKEIAKPFQKWVTKEVLPSIRKTGSFSLKQDEPDLEKIEKRTKLISFSTELVTSFKKAFLEIGIVRKEELAVTVNRAVQKETTVDFIEIADKKGIATLEKYYTVTELCEIVMNGNFSEEAKKLVSTKNRDKPRPQNLNKLLEESGFQIREDEVWKATEKGSEFSDFVQNKSRHSEKTVFHTVWKIEVLKEIF